MTTTQPITVRDILDRTTDYFTQKGISTARLDAQLLIGKALGKTRLQLYLNFDYPLAEEELARARDLVRRRANREPVAYILGSREFAGRDFKVRPGVLIPRPDTEILLEEAARELRVRFMPVKPVPEVDPDEDAAELTADSPAEGTAPETPAAAPAPEEPAEPPVPLHILEFGIGSGALAVSLAADFPAMEVTATEINRDAATTAAENAAAHGVADRVTIRVQPDFSGIDGRFHAIVSNPPYIDPAEKDELEPDVVNHEPAEALFADDEGLHWYRFLAAEASRLLLPNGFLAVEIGHKQRAAVEQIFTQAGLNVVRSVKDYASRDRVVVAEPAQPASMGVRRG